MIIIDFSSSARSKKDHSLKKSVTFKHMALPSEQLPCPTSRAKKSRLHDDTEIYAAKIFQDTSTVCGYVFVHGIFPLSSFYPPLVR